MSYIINRYDINTLSANAFTNTNGWASILRTEQTQIDSFINDHEWVGTGAEQVKEYLHQVHGTLLRLIIPALQLYYESVVSYAAGFSDFNLNYSNGRGAFVGDDDILTEDHLNELIQKIDHIVDHIQETTPRAQNVINTVSDIMPDHNMQAPEVYSAPLEDQSECIHELITKVREYDESYANDTLDMIRDLIAEAGILIDQVRGAGKATIDSGSTEKLFSGTNGPLLVEKILAAEMTVQMNTELMKKGAEYINKVYDDRKIVATELAKTARIDAGLKLFGTGTIAVIGAIASCGTAIPEELVVVTGVINGILLTAGLSDAAEGVQLIYLGATGDIETPAYNLFRDGGFNGDQDKYDLFISLVEGLDVYVDSCGNIITAGMEASADQGMKVMSVTAIEEAATVWTDLVIDQDVEKLSDKLGDTDPFTQIAIKEGLGFLLSKGADTAIHGAGDAVFLRPDGIGEYVPPKFEELSDEQIRVLAEEAMKGNADANGIVIGKHDLDGVDYEVIARKYYEQYFNLDNWDELAETYSGTQMWMINQKFLEMHIQAGDRIYLSHNPDDFRDQYTSGFGREIAYLEAKGFTFEEVTLIKGDTTNTVYVAVMKPIQENTQ